MAPSSQLPALKSKHHLRIQGQPLAGSSAPSVKQKSGTSNMPPLIQFSFSSKLDSKSTNMSIRQTATRTRLTDTPEGAGGWEEAEGRVSSPSQSQGLPRELPGNSLQPPGFLGPSWQRRLGTKHGFGRGRTSRSTAHRALQGKARLKVILRNQSCGTSEGPSSKKRGSSPLAGPERTAFNSQAKQGKALGRTQPARCTHGAGARPGPAALQQSWPWGEGRKGAPS